MQLINVSQTSDYGCDNNYEDKTWYKKTESRDPATRKQVSTKRKVILEQATKAQRGSRRIALLFL